MILDVLVSGRDTKVFANCLNSVKSLSHYPTCLERGSGPNAQLNWVQTWRCSRDEENRQSRSNALKSAQLGKIALLAK